MQEINYSILFIEIRCTFMEFEVMIIIKIPIKITQIHVTVVSLLIDFKEINTYFSIFKI